jgi:hypothetical protein
VETKEEEMKLAMLLTIMIILVAAYVVIFGMYLKNVRLTTDISECQTVNHELLNGRP